ncbi:MAG: thioredoxin [Verrucomicrobia bacterium]|nr:thioredoxin [Verrucomicrobiota bacterium]
MSEPLHVDSANFEKEVLQASTPTVVDFYAVWCAPCRMMGPIFESLAREYQGRVKFVKVDVDRAPDLANRYQVRGVPTLAIFSQGRLVDTIVGLAPPEAIRQAVETLAAPQAN